MNCFSYGGSDGFEEEARIVFFFAGGGVLS